jgi:hypothetical protein
LNSLEAIVPHTYTCMAFLHYQLTLKI